MSITSWTSNGMQWDSDTIQLGSLYDHCEAIRLATIERIKAAGQTPTGMLADGYDLRLASLKSFIDDCDAKIKALVPLYVRHTDNSGNWDGLPYDKFAPAWTVSEAKGYGYRTDGAPKGQGYFGELIRYDDPSSYSTELTIDGASYSFPLLVPTLTNDEVRWLLSNEGFTDAILSKAQAYAESRIAAGKNPFAQDGEQIERSGLPGFKSKLSPPWHWIEQQYQILNNLKWIKRNPVYLETGVKYIAIVGWAEAQQAFKAEDWSVNTGTYLFIRHFAGGSSLYEIGRNYMIVDMSDAPFAGVGDFYAYASTETSIGRVYANNDYPATADTWYRVAADVDKNTPVNIGKITANSMPQPNGSVYEWLFGYHYKGTSQADMSQWHFVYKPAFAFQVD